MNVRLFQPERQLERLAFLILTFITLSAGVVSTQAQRTGQRERGIVRSINQKEMDRLLHLKPILATKDDASRRAVLKQVSEDFKNLQELNNKMMADAWSRQELNYRHISKMVSQIRTKATRLKRNLLLPKAQNEQTSEPSDLNISDPEKFRAALLQLDRHIMSFATNPLFQKADVVEIELATRASRDLAIVLELGQKLRECAEKLRKAARKPH